MIQNRKKKQRFEEDSPPTKIEYDVAKYMKKHVATKTTRFLNHPVKYFNSNRAIDVLLESEWATGENAIFTNREAVVQFGNKLLKSKFFHRAKKIAINDFDLSPRELKKKKEEEAKNRKKDDRRRKVKLNMHPEQVFVDGSEAYVWIWDPIPFWYYIAGSLVLFGGVGICLFPL